MYQLTRSLSGNALEDIVDEGVENSHRLVGDTSVRVDLLEDCQQSTVVSDELDVPDNDHAPL